MVQTLGGDMQRMAMVGILAALLGCAAAGVDGTNGGECSCPPGPRGPKGDKGDKGEPGSADGSASGSRLTYLGKTLRGEDGSVFVQQGGFFDEELGAPCSPSNWLDGRLRCLPISHPSANFGSMQFADSSCSRPAAILPLHASDCETPPFLYTSGSFVCGSIKYRFFRTGRRLEKAFGVQGEDCVPIEIGTQAAFELEEEMPSSAFVAFE